MPRKVLQWMFARHAPLSLRPRLDPQQWRWLAAFLGNCNAEHFAHNKANMQRIAHYSLACLRALRAETGLTYDHGTGGVLQIFQTAEELDAAHAAAKVLASFNVAHRLVDLREAIRIEPSLGHATVSLAGGLHLPDDETGDCHLFTTRLAEKLAGQDIVFRFNTPIEGLLTDGDAVAGVKTAHETLTADRYVVALANGAPALLRPVGIDIPVYPVKGYAITIANARPDRSPRSSVMDEHSKVMVTRLGDRLRAAGIAEIAGHDHTIDSKPVETVRRAVSALFPEAGDYAEAIPWTGLRPMTPDGPPYLGATRFRNLLLNVGQGSNGWTQACGCGRIVADLVSQRQPEIDLSGLTLERGTLRSRS